MDHEGFRILGLAASLRRASIHRGIIRAAHEVDPGRMSCEGFDLARIPYFNQDVEDGGIPEPVEEFREKIRAYDALLIATPEYDYAIPGVLTSALDWALRSRHDPTPLRHKPVGIAGASPGGAGTARGQMVLRQVLLHPQPTSCPNRRCSSLSRARSSTLRRATSPTRKPARGCAASSRRWPSGAAGLRNRPKANGDGPARLRSDSHIAFLYAPTFGEG
jgi:chromate reductase, NAD(P)H dehydrogenase (quinone)